MRQSVADAVVEPVRQDGDDGLLAELRDALVVARRQTEIDPSCNPIRLLARDLAKRLDDGALKLAAVEQVIQRLTADAFAGRAERLAAYLGERDPQANAQRLAAVLHRLAHGPDGTTLPFDAFKSAVERAAFGVVITAHPTFSLAVELRTRLIELTFGRDRHGAALDEASRSALLREVAASEHKPDRTLDLDAEHAQSIAAIENLQTALRRVYGIALDVAHDLYPERWSELTPRLLTIASWVGYDIDGRSDIGWHDTFCKRLRVQAVQLRRYRDAVQAARAQISDGAPAAATLELLDARLALAVKQIDDDLAAFGGDARDPAWRERLRAGAKRMWEERAGRLTEPRQLIDLLTRAIGQSNDADLVRALTCLRAEIATNGLSLAHTHVRINAVQLHNAVRHRVDLRTAPDDPSHRNTYLATLAKLIDEARPATINFGSLLTEEATAKRVFMVVRQMLTYLDAEQPVRFLIAECETPFTLLTALFYAKLFGVADRLDISPLFETRKALEQGPRIVEQALASDAYRAYVRDRGRLCIQTGFSDAGRYLGQTAAAFLIERLRLRVAALLAEQGLGDVELVIFDTHGESIGRGGHPGSMAERLAYIDTPASRARFAEHGLAFKQEVSFQGGDGYQYFMTPDSAFATLCRVLEHALAPPARADDPFYAAAGYADEFFAVIVQFNQALMDDPDFAALLGAFGHNLLYPTGSRALKRQSDLGAPALLEHASQIRAIPHNGILQQLGYLANTIGGVGLAVAKDPRRFQRLYRDSARFRQLMGMVEHAFKFSDLTVFQAYLDLFDPGQWLLRAARERDDGGAEELLEVVEVVVAMALHERLVRVLHRLRRDHIALDRALREHRRRSRDQGAEPIAIDPATRDQLHLLHGLRLALIQEVFKLAMRVPNFSARHDVTRESLVLHLFHLDVPAALAKLDEIFPQTDDPAETDFGEPASYQGADGHSYAQEHAHIFDPIGARYGLIRRISTGVVHAIGALG